MSLAYPIAATVELALSDTGVAARTRHEAEQLAEGGSIQGLVTDWFTPPGDAKDEALKQAGRGQDLGFVQCYEDRNGDPVLAVTYWKLSTRPAQKPKPAPKSRADVQPDHTDDLYFKHGRTKRRRARKKAQDPNQMDLFGKADTNTD